MKHCRFCQFELRKEKPLQQLSDVSALLAAMHLPMVMLKTARECENLKKTRGTARLFLAFYEYLENSYVSKEHN
jgi:hypothetical protein